MTSKYLTMVILIIMFGVGGIPRAVGHEPLSKEAMEALARKTFQGIPDAQSIKEPAATNPHLGGMKRIANPLQSHAFWCLSLQPNKAYTPRSFLAVSRTGIVYYPLSKDNLLKILAAQDTARWKDGQFLKAAVLAVHLQAFSNEDGWKVVKSPKEFWAIEFNMHLAPQGQTSSGRQADQGPRSYPASRLDQGCLLRLAPDRRRPATLGSGHWAQARYPIQLARQLWGRRLRLIVARRLVREH